MSVPCVAGPCNVKEGPKMSILDLLSHDGHTVKRVAVTHGGEYAGPCPFCGGQDRFRVWPEQGNGGRYWCRQCNARGDAIQYLRDVRSLSYREALEVLNLEVKNPWRPLRDRIETRHIWFPRKIRAASQLWQEKAQEFLQEAQRQLWAGTGTATRQWLRNRGLTEGTVRKVGLGLNARDAYLTRESWELEPVMNEKTGKPKPLWLPEGLIIPCVQNSRVIRLRIRRPQQKAEPRYYIVPGSESMAMHLKEDSKVCVVVESELDAALVWQECRSVAGVVALGNAQAKPDIDTYRMLTEAETVLISLDSDRAGTINHTWWTRHIKQAKWWPIPGHKDPTEAHQAGLDLRQWLLAGLSGNECVHKVLSEKEKNGAKTQMTQRPAVRREAVITCYYNGVKRHIHPEVCEWHFEKKDPQCLACNER